MRWFVVFGLLLLVSAEKQDSIPITLNREQIDAITAGKDVVLDPFGLGGHGKTQAELDAAREAMTKIDVTPYEKDQLARLARQRKKYSEDAKIWRSQDKSIFILGEQHDAPGVAERVENAMRKAVLGTDVLTAAEGLNHVKLYEDALAERLISGDGSEKLRERLRGVSVEDIKHHRLYGLDNLFLFEFSQVLSDLFRGPLEDQPYDSVFEGVIAALIDPIRSFSEYFRRVPESTEIEGCTALYDALLQFARLRSPGDELPNLKYWKTQPHQWAALLKIVARAMLEDAEHILTTESGFPSAKVQALLDQFDISDRHKSLDAWLETHEMFEVELRAKVALGTVKSLQAAHPHKKVYLVATAFHVGHFKRALSPSWTAISPDEFDCTQFGHTPACERHLASQKQEL